MEYFLKDINGRGTLKGDINQKKDEIKFPFTVDTIDLFKEREKCFRLTQKTHKCYTRNVI